jgi:hypothetical protein
MLPKHAAFALCIAGALSSVNDCRGAVIASDTASDGAYADGWQGLDGAVPEETGKDNGGQGFLPWEFTGTYWDAKESPYTRAHFLDTGPSAFNDLGAPAFSMTNANVPFEGFTSAARRPFAAPLEVGQRISVDVDNPVMDPLRPFDDTGFIIQLLTAATGEANGVERFALYTYHGFNEEEWSIADKRGGETATGFSDVEGSDGFRFAFTLVAEERYNLTITPLAGGQAMSFQGELARTGMGKIASIQLVIYGNGSGDGREQATGERELYFNNLSLESIVIEGTPFRRADANSDGERDIGDAVFLLFSLFVESSPQPACAKSADASDDGALNVTDALTMLNVLFNNGAPLSAPWSECGNDFTQDSLSCVQYEPCAAAGPAG